MCLTGPRDVARHRLRIIDRAAGRAMTPVFLIPRNPATGEELSRVAATRPDEVAKLVDRARDASREWAARPMKDRVAVVRRWSAILSREAEPLARAIRDEIGKPLPEAQMEVTGALDSLRWIVKNARSALADSRARAGLATFRADGSGSFAVGTFGRGRDRRDVELPDLPRFPRNRRCPGRGERSGLETFGNVCRREQPLAGHARRGGLPERPGRHDLRRTRCREGADGCRCEQSLLHRRGRGRAGDRGIAGGAGASRWSRSWPGSTRRSSCPTLRWNRRRAP